MPEAGKNCPQLPFLVFLVPLNSKYPKLSQAIRKRPFDNGTHRKLFLLEMEAFWGTWVAQSVKHQTLDFGSGHDLTVCGFEPCIGLYAVSMLGIVSSLPLKINEYFFK